MPEKMNSPIAPPPTARGKSRKWLILLGVGILALILVGNTIYFINADSRELARQERVRIARENEQKRQEEQVLKHREAEQKRQQEEQARIDREEELKRDQEERTRITREAEQKRQQEEQTRKAREEERKRNGVLINGVRWAMCNVDSPGTFAIRPEDPGMFYQWNRRKGWPATGMLDVYSDVADDKWAKANDPCPTGWRIPTGGELELLVDAGSEWTAVNRVEGCRFGSGNSTIFLPAAGTRLGTGHLSVSSNGYYWSATRDEINEEYCLAFHSTFVYTKNAPGDYGMSVRCVSE